MVANKLFVMYEFYLDWLTFDWLKLFNKLFKTPSGPICTRFFLQNGWNSLEYIIYLNKKVKIKLVRILKSRDILLYSILNEVCLYENAFYNTVLLYLNVYAERTFWFKNVS